MKGRCIATLTWFEEPRDYVPRLSLALTRRSLRWHLRQRLARRALVTPQCMQIFLRRRRETASGNAMDGHLDSRDDGGVIYECDGAQGQCQADLVLEGQGWRVGRRRRGEPTKSYGRGLVKRRRSADGASPQVPGWARVPVLPEGVVGSLVQVGVVLAWRLPKSG